MSDRKRKQPSPPMKEVVGGTVTRRDESLQRSSVRDYDPPPSPRPPESRKENSDE